MFWISLFGFDNCWKYFLVRPKSNKPSCHRFNGTFWQILFKCKLDFSKEQTVCSQKDWSGLFPKSWEIVCVLKPKVLLATNPGGGKLVLLASSEMEQDFLKLQALYNPFLSFLECWTYKYLHKLQNREVGTQMVPKFLKASSNCEKIC